MEYFSLAFTTSVYSRAYFSVMCPAFKATLKHVVILCQGTQVMNERAVSKSLQKWLRKEALLVLIISSGWVVASNTNSGMDQLLTTIMLKQKRRLGTK